MSRSFTAWCTGGLETQLFTLLVLSGFVLFLLESERKTARPWRSSVVFALATFTRPDAGLFVVCSGVAFLLLVLSGRRSFRSLCLWMVPYLAIVGTHVFWRYAYYGFWLPNTFYAKVNGFWWKQGWIYIRLFLCEYHFLWFVPFLLFGVAYRHDLRSSLLAAAVLAQLAHVGSVGGDHMEFRLLIPVVPYLYWLIVDGIAAAGELLRTRDRNGAASILTALGAAALLFATQLGSMQPHEVTPSTMVSTTMRVGAYGDYRALLGQELRALVDRGVLPPDLRIETGGAGALPYYTDWYVLDKRGLNDVRVAREEIEDRGLVGHEHAASLGYVREREIAVVLLGQGLLHAVDARGLGEKVEEAKVWMEFYNRAARTQEERLRLKCLATGDGRVLIFGTNLDESRFREVLGHLASCWKEERPSAYGQGHRPRAETRSDAW